MDEEIEIPAANKTDIRKYPEYPSDEIVKDIKDHIRETGKPHTWRGHSHTKPAVGAKVLYREEFDVPDKGSYDGYAPCPCCRPTSRVYKRAGKIAWFPDEAVIRLIGPQCFKALNPDGHEKALADLRARQKHERELATIALHRSILPQTIEALDAIIPIAEAVEATSEELRNALEDLRRPLWQEASSDGVLSTRRRQMVSFVRRDGSTGEREDEIVDPFVRIIGTTVLRPAKRHSEKLRIIKSGFVIAEEKLSRMGNDIPEKDRIFYAGVLPKGRADIDAIRRILSDRRSFFASENLAAISRWGNEPEAAFDIELSIRGTTLHVGASSGRHRISVDRHLFAAVPELPMLSDDKGEHTGS